MFSQTKLSYKIVDVRQTTHHLQQCHNYFFEEVNLSQFFLYFFQEYNILKKQKNSATKIVLYPILG